MHIFFSIFDLLYAYKLGVVNPPAKAKVQPVSDLIKNSEWTSKGYRLLTVEIPRTCSLFEQQSRVHSMLVCGGGVMAQASAVQLLQPESGICCQRS
jgi:hypothetical protein